MRKNRVIALVIASLVSTAALAQAQAPASPRAGRPEMGPGLEGRGARGLFRGIVLSNAEQAKVKEIRAKYETEEKSIHEAMRPAMQEARAAHQKRDTVAARAALDRTKGDRETLKALRERERVEIRAALTPENQKTFDANVQEMAKRRTEWEQGGKEGHGKGGWRRGRNG